jgi:hypothetical protein
MPRWKPKEADLTQEIVKRLFDYDPETGVLIRAEGRRKGAPAGYQMNKGYWIVSVGSTRFLAHRLIWLWTHGRWPLFIDHINRNRLDNRLCNLREATKVENCQNKSARSNNTSGVTGVTWDATRQRWKGQIIVNGRVINLKRHKTFEAAVEERLEAERKHFGAFAPQAHQAPSGAFFMGN